MNKINIHLAKNDYTGGETVEGKMVLELYEPVLARGIRIRFHGFERSSWSTGTGKNRHTHSETRELFDEERTVFGKPPLSPGALMSDALSGLFTKQHYEVLTPGTYEYPFSYRLPDHLPPDYDDGSPYRIAYEIKAYVDIPLKFDLSCVRNIAIHETGLAKQIHPISARNGKSFLLDSGKIEVQADLERNVFYPGGNVKGWVSLVNYSQKKIDGIIVSLRNIVELTAHSSHTTKTWETVLFRMPEPVVAKGELVRIPIEFNLPENLYGTIASSRLVRLRYEMVFQLDLSWAIDLKAVIPITLIETEGVPSGAAWHPA